MDSLHSHATKRRLVRAAVMLSAAVTSAALIATVAFAGSAYDESQRTTNGINWHGESYLYWDPQGNGYAYWGAAFTETNAGVADQLQVNSKGRELCYFVVVDTDWDTSNFANDTWQTGISGNGGFGYPAQCGGGPPTLSSYGWHRLDDGGQFGTTNTDAYDVPPLE